MSRKFDWDKLAAVYRWGHLPALLMGFFVLFQFGPAFSLAYFLGLAAVTRLIIYLADRSVWASEQD